MSLNLNRVTLAGNLTRDPELRQTTNDRAVANFGLAINRRWRNQQTNEQVEEATFIDIEAWGRTAELVGQYLHKGSPAYIEGRLKLDTWEDKEGQKRSRLKIVAENVRFLGSRSTGDGEGHEAGEAATPQPHPTARRPVMRPAPAKTAVPASDGEAPF